MKDRVPVNTGGERFNIWNYTIANYAISEYGRISRKYNIRDRLGDMQRDIFEKYFLSYRVLREKANSGMLDKATEVETEIIGKIPIIGNLARLAETVADSIREVSSNFRQEGDRLAEEYAQNLTGEIGAIMPSKLLRVANMMNVYLNLEKKPELIEQTINNYLDREIPKVVRDEQ